LSKLGYNTQLRDTHAGPWWKEVPDRQNFVAGEEESDFGP
jgi:hypothetical protein